MSVVSIISAERERYTAHFEAIVAGMVSSGSSHARELLISINNDAIPYPYRYLRVDLIEKAADGSNQLSEVWLDPPHDFEATGFQLGSVRIEIYPFTWCSTQIAFDRPLSDLSKLEAVLTAWLDIDDKRVTPSGVANAIHSVSPVETNGQLWFFTIDFGTAAADGMLDLIDFIANEALAERIIITSHSRA